MGGPIQPQAETQEGGPEAVCPVLSRLQAEPPAALRASLGHFISADISFFPVMGALAVLRAQGDVDRVWDPARPSLERGRWLQAPAGRVMCTRAARPRSQDCPILSLSPGAHITGFSTCFQSWCRVCWAESSGRGQGTFPAWPGLGFLTKRLHPGAIAHTDFVSQFSVRMQPVPVWGASLCGCACLNGVRVCVGTCSGENGVEPLLVRPQ